MKIIQNGVAVDKSYPEICRELGYSVASNFVKITCAGEIGFWCGKPNEVKGLLADVRAHGMRPTAALVKAARR